MAAWASCFWHERLKLLVTVYVDDIKVSGPEGNLKDGWALIKSKISIGEVSKASLYLGCIHKKTVMKVPELGDVSVMEYDMECYLKQIVDDYEELATELTGKTVKLGRVKTPFLEEDCSQADARAPINKGDPIIDCPHCKHSFSPNADIHTKQQLLEYLTNEVGGKKGKTKCEKDHLLEGPHRGPDATPDSTEAYEEPCAIAAEKDPEELATHRVAEATQRSQEHQKRAKNPAAQITMPLQKKFSKSFKKIRERAAKSRKMSAQDQQDRGQLGPLAISILMRVLYAAREARFDLLRAVNKMSCTVAFWNSDSDLRMERLISYIKSTLHYRQYGWIGDSPEQLQPHAYTDADFAGCTRTLRSTTGLQLQVEGPHSCFPIAASSKRQPHVADSTPAAELSALHTLLKTVAIPFVDIAEKILPQVRGIIHEDNTTAIQAIKTGKNQTMRFLPRSNGVSVQMLHENLNHKKPEVPYEVEYTDTALMVADIHTKGFTDEKKWTHAHTMAGVMAPDALQARMLWQAKYYGWEGKITKEVKEEELV